MLTITQFHGGHANNVMPDECWLDGTIRCYSNEVFKITQNKILQIAESTASLFGCTSTVTFYESYPAVINSPEHTATFQAFASSLLGPSMVTSEGLPIPASEDFSYFLEARPGCFFFLGTGQKERTFTPVSMITRMRWWGMEHSYGSDGSWRGWGPSDALV